MMNSTQNLPDDYPNLLKSLKTKIQKAQISALKSVNRELVTLYRDIGQLIAGKQENEGWGKATVKRLAKDLQIAFPGTRGFSTTNLWNMRSFYISYRDNEKLQSLTGEISWTHNMLILEKCKDSLQREYYIRMSRKQSWSVRVLRNHIDSQSYERTLTSQTNFTEQLPTELHPEAQLVVRDEYNLDFLELSDNHSERQLEKAIISKIEEFLREMGGLFSFMGSQYRLEVGNKEYFIDLLLYHRRLKSLVAIELKIGEFVPEFVGKMQFYLAALDDFVRLEGENPSIGIILCKSKDKTTVEYALRESNKPIGVSAYNVVKQLPKELESDLPSTDQIIHLLENIQ